MFFNWIFLSNSRETIQCYPVTWQKVLFPQKSESSQIFLSASSTLDWIQKVCEQTLFIPDVESELIEIENPSRLNVKNLWLSRTERRSQPLNFSYLLHLIRKPPKTKSWFGAVHTEADGVILIYFPKFWRQRPASLTHFKRIQLMSYCCVHILDWRMTLRIEIWWFAFVCHFTGITVCGTQTEFRWPFIVVM